MIDLRESRYFVAVAEELSFTRAADRCGISQPPLSRAIAQMEQKIGVKLFIRDRHRVSLTEAGRGLLEDTRKILSSADQAVSRARQIGEGHAGQLTIAMGGLVVYKVSPRLVREFSADYPHVEISYRALSIPSQLPALRDGDIDIAVIRLPVEDDIIDSLVVHQELLMLAMPSGHMMCKELGPVKLSSLKNEPFVSLPACKGFNYHTDLLALCRYVGFVPNIKYEVSTTEALIGIVGCGKCVAMMPGIAADLPSEAVEFRAIDTSELPPELTQASIGIAWNHLKASPLVKNFVEHVRERHAV